MESLRQGSEKVLAQESRLIWLVRVLNSNSITPSRTLDDVKIGPGLAEYPKP